MVEEAQSQPGPLTRAMVEQIDATLLPTLERHHLRLLAHCLASFQEIASPSTQGAFPSREAQEEWCQGHPLLRDDPQFGVLLLRQFEAAGRQLETLAQTLGITPLELTLEQLINAAVEAAKKKHLKQ